MSIAAIEVYKSPRDIPKEFRRHTWGKENCWLVAYWTYDFMMKPFRKTALPYRAAQYTVRPTGQEGGRLEHWHRVSCRICHATRVDEGRISPRPRRSYTGA